MTRSPRSATDGATPGARDAGLLERDQQLAALVASCDAAGEGTGSVVLVSGDAGIGKSTLVAAAAAEVDDAGRVLRGACDDFLTTRPLGPLRDVARRLTGAVPAAIAAGDTPAVLDALLDELDHPLHPTVLVLEDVHWADEATLDAVRFLGRRVADLRASLWLTYRERELGPDHPLRGVLGVLPPAAVTRLRLEPLSPAAVAALTADTTLDPELVSAATGGNPFFVTELVRSGDATVPASVADAVLGRVRDLPAATRDALARLAVMPGTVEHDLLAAVVDDRGDLRPAERAGLVVAADDGVRFRHELARRAVEGSLTTTERLVHHGRVLTALRDGDDPDASRVLHHALAAGRHDLVVEVGPSAAHEAHLADAHREAVEVQARVLELADDLEPSVHARVLDEHVRTLAALVRFDEAYRHAVELVSVLTTTDDARAAARALLLLSRMAWWSGRRPEAVAAAASAREHIAGAGDEDLEAELAVAEAFHTLVFAPGADAVEAAERALVAARRVRRVDLEAQARNYRGCARATANLPGAVEDLRVAVDLGEESGDADVAARAHLNLLRTVVMERPDVDVEALVTRALALVDDHDLAHYRLYVRAHHATHMLDSGRWTEAEALLRSLLTDVTDGGLFETPVRTALARVAVRTGAEDAAALGEVAWTTAARSGAPQYLAHARALRAETAWLAGDDDALDRLAEEVAHERAPALYLAETLQVLAWSGRAVQVPPDCPEPWRTSLGGDWQAAAGAFATRRQPYERALALASSGHVDQLLDALSILDDLGATPAGRLVRARLRRLGERPPRGPQRRTRAHPLGLTARQAQVLDRLLDGASNNEIAVDLVLSVRTVENHVSAILRTLGVASREDAAAAARRATGR